MFDFSLVKDVLLVISIMLNILVFFKYPYKYLCARYEGARKRKEKFYAPLIEDMKNLCENLTKIKWPLNLDALEEKHLALLISQKTMLEIENLMRELERFKRAYMDLEYYIYPQILNSKLRELREIECRYWTNLGVVRANEGYEFITRVSRSSTLNYLLACRILGREIKLEDLPSLRDMLSSIERAHINRELDKLLNHISGHICGTFAFNVIKEARTELLILLEKIIPSLEKEADKLSSKIYGTFYGLRDVGLVNEYTEKRASIKKGMPI